MSEVRLQGTGSFLDDGRTDILEDLSRVRWQVVLRTFGNDHATLIRMLVDWWITHDPSHNWVLEGGPSFKLPGTGMTGGDQCDAVFCRGAQAVGILEVEGTRHKYTIQKVRRYFQSPDPTLKDLRFAVVVLYRCEPRGGRVKASPCAASPASIAAACDVSASCPLHDPYLVAVEKEWVLGLTGIRARNPYYSGQVHKIRGSWFRGSNSIAEIDLLRTGGVDAVRGFGRTTRA